MMYLNPFYQKGPYYILLFYQHLSSLLEYMFYVGENFVFAFIITKIYNFFPFLNMILKIFIFFHSFPLFSFKSEFKVEIQLQNGSWCLVL